MIVDKDSLVPNSLSLPSRASFVLKLKSKNEIPEADKFARAQGLPLFMVGQGTNIIPREYVKGVVTILNFGGVKIKKLLMEVQGGEGWDNAVNIAVNNGLSGIEGLSAIPGTAGAAPVQNIGAYGSEIADSLDSLEAYDRQKNEYVRLKRKDCGFGYRNSIFKRQPQRFIISSISLKLSAEKPGIPDYKDVKKYFEEKRVAEPSLPEIREAIISIRKRKLPDIRKFPNAGSYFINPIINGEKIHAGRLIEEAGLKGMVIGKLAVSPQSALILTNPQGASFSELLSAERFIVQKVFQRSSILLHREPIMIG